MMQNLISFATNNLYNRYSGVLWLLFEIIISFIVIGIIVGVIFLIFYLVRKNRAHSKSLETIKEQEQVRKSLGETLKQYRIKSNMTQEFVAEKLGVSRQAVSKWETDLSDPSTSNLLALAKLYGVSPEELLKNITLN